MKYLKTYNERLGDKLTVPNDDEILNKMKDYSPIKGFGKSIIHNYLKGIEYYMPKLDINDINVSAIIESKIYYTSPEIVKYFLDNYKDFFSDTDIYLLEKYILGLHQNEEKNYEKYIKNNISKYTFKKSTVNLECELIYDENNIVIGNYFDDNLSYKIINLKNIMYLNFKYKYHLNDNQAKIILKYAFEKIFKFNEIYISNADDVFYKE